MEYDRCRKAEAEQLGIDRVSVLDAEVNKRRDKGEADSRGGRKLDLPSPDPWPEPVAGVALVDDLTAALSKYLALPEHADVAMALWVLHSHVFEAANITPRLALTSPEKRCGKTTAQEVLARLVAKPLPTSNISAAALFRTVEVAQPTLLIDEADTFLDGRDELRGILNSGHARNGAVIRTVGEDHEPRQFKTFAPVTIAKIGTLPDTLEDRSIVIRMRRRRPDERVAKLRYGRTPDLDVLGRKAARWGADNMLALRDAGPDTPKELHDRAADNWGPLLAIADAIGGEWPAHARRAAVTLSAGTDDAESVRVMLLADIQAMFSEHETDRLASGDICDALAKMGDKPWPEWGRSHKPITTRGLARQLSVFQIKPKTIRLDGMDKTAKGYLLVDFTDAFSRYPPSLSVTPSQPRETGAYSDNLSVTTGDDVTDRNPRKPAENGQCYGVTDREGDTPDKWRAEV